ncbi:helix-turn-helix domain-containing protein [Streptosporangium sp. NPDC020072]|uniref:TetR/AcrR family transcriptional regulator n=1 Tax=Streptosporangium sp. NPDC020072 TaxID=3154788 RepID=UPI0034186D35
MRADARRNRELIVTTALGLFAERGAAVSMEEIARAAGLGVGTLYRHFPDRQALVEDIALDALRRLMTFGETVTAEGMTGDRPCWQSLRLVVEHCAGLPLALIKALSPETTANPELARLERDLNALLERLARGAQEEGTLRDDIPPGEVVGLLNVAVCRPGARAGDHLTTVILDGLRR